MAGFANRPNYDVSRDGRCVMVADGYGLTSGRLDVDLHFPQEREELLPQEDE